MNSYPLNKSIVDVKYRSFYLESELCTSIEQVYLYCDNGCWYEIAIENGESSLKICDEPVSEIVGYREDLFYPVDTLSTIDCKQFGRIISIAEYLWDGLTYESCGFCFTFDNGTSLRIVEKNGELLVNSEDDEDLVAGCEKMQICSLPAGKPQRQAV